jgi:hypothetical protein
MYIPRPERASHRATRSRGFGLNVGRLMLFFLRQATCRVLPPSFQKPVGSRPRDPSPIQRRCVLAIP